MNVLNFLCVCGGKAYVLGGHFQISKISRNLMYIHMIMYVYTVHIYLHPFKMGMA